MSTTSLEAALSAMDRQVLGVLNRLAAVAPRVAELAAPVIASAVEAEYANGRDPYGQPWAPLRPATLRKGRRPPPLTDMGLMRGRTTVRANVNGRPGIAVSLPLRPGAFHQAGTSRMVARQVLPYRGIPRMWADALRSAALQAMREAGGSHA